MGSAGRLLSATGNGEVHGTSSAPEEWMKSAMNGSLA